MQAVVAQQLLFNYSCWTACRAEDRCATVLRIMLLLMLRNDMSHIGNVPGKQYFGVKPASCQLLAHCSCPTAACRSVPAQTASNTAVPILIIKDTSYVCVTIVTLSGWPGGEATDLLSSSTAQLLNWLALWVIIAASSPADMYDSLSLDQSHHSVLLARQYTKVIFGGDLRDFLVGNCWQVCTDT